VDCRPAEMVGGTEVGSSRSQLVYKADVAMATGDMERRLTVVVVNVDVGAASHQQSQYVHSARLVHCALTAESCSPVAVTRSVGKTTETVDTFCGTKGNGMAHLPYTGHQPAREHITLRL